MKLLLIRSLLLLLAVLAQARGAPDSCQGRCGDRVMQSYQCQCNKACTRYNDCCSDYSQQCQSTAPATADSCQGRCGGRYDRALPCQCNSACQRYGNCCGDFSDLCQAQAQSGANCEALTTVSQRLWDSDVDRLSASDVVLNLQVQQADDRSRLSDRSPQPLFTYVNESELASPVYQTFLALLDNYDPVKGHPENVTGQEHDEEEAFLDAMMNTSVVDALYDYLQCQGIVNSRADLRAAFRRIWFDIYPRSGNSDVPDTSGFEHVMVGEYKSSSSVNGFHSWLAFYESEKTGEMNYYGHTCPERPNVVCAAFDWNNRKKTLASFFVRVSPAFDLSIYSLCYLASPGQCRTVVDGRRLDIQTYNTGGHLATAFIKADSVQTLSTPRIQLVGPLGLGMWNAPPSRLGGAEGLDN